MPRSGKSLLKLFKRSSSSPSTPSPPSTPPPPPPQPPNAYLCPISGHLMADPVIIPTGHTFERAAIEACKHLNFIPPILSPAVTSFTVFLSFALTPNLTLKTAILNWCDLSGHPRPLPFSQEAARGIVGQLKAAARTEVGASNQDQEPSSSSSSGDDDQRPLEDRMLRKLSKIKTEQSLRRALFEITSTMDPSTASSPTAADPIELEMFTHLQASDTSTQESALLTLIHTAIKSSECKISLCTERIVALIIPMLHSLNRNIQINATAAISMFAFEQSNRSKIVRWRAVSGLLHVLGKGDLDARANAATAIYDLTKDEQNRMIIGSLKAMQPLLENVCERFSSPALRRQAAKALCNLTLCPFNLPLLQRMGAVPKLLEVATDNSSDDLMSLRSRALQILYNLADGSKGREELMDAGAVDVMFRMVREEGGGMDVECLAVMHRICMNCPLRFRELAMGAGAEGVLAEEKTQWEGDGKAMAKEMLEVILQTGEGSSQELSSDTTVAESSRSRSSQLFSQSRSSQLLAESSQSRISQLFSQPRSLQLLAVLEEEEVEEDGQE